MAASVWTGFLTFGLISMPVRLFSGARGSRVSFHMLHRDDNVRIKQQLYCPEDERVVDRSEGHCAVEVAFRGRAVTNPAHRNPAVALDRSGHRPADRLRKLRREVARDREEAVRPVRIHDRQLATI